MQNPCKIDAKFRQSSCEIHAKWDQLNQIHSVGPRSVFDSTKMHWVCHATCGPLRGPKIHAKSMRNSCKIHVKFRQSSCEIYAKWDQLDQIHSVGPRSVFDWAQVSWVQPKCIEFVMPRVGHWEGLRSMQNSCKIHAKSMQNRCKIHAK